MNNRVLPATAQGGVVTCEGVPVSVAEILSEGAGSSIGVLVIEGDRAWYLAKTSPDLKTTLEKVIAALGQTKTALDRVVSGYTGLKAADVALAALTTDPTTAATNVGIAHTALDIQSALVTAAATAIDAAKTELETLKGVLK